MLHLRVKKTGSSTQELKRIGTIPLPGVRGWFGVAKYTIKVLFTILFVTACCFVL